MDATRRSLDQTYQDAPPPPPFHPGRGRPSDHDPDYDRDDFAVRHATSRAAGLARRAGGTHALRGPPPGVARRVAVYAVNPLKLSEALAPPLAAEAAARPAPPVPAATPARAGRGRRSLDRAPPVAAGFARYRRIGLGSRFGPSREGGDSGYRALYLAGFRVAVPRDFDAEAAGAERELVASGGPHAAGYAIVGDTIVPAALGFGEQKILADYAWE